MRQFHISNPVFPIRGYSLPGVRALWSLRLHSGVRLMKAANALVPIAGGNKHPSFSEPGLR